jgi:hypothetical protein
MPRPKRNGPLTNERCPANVAEGQDIENPDHYKACGQKMFQDAEDEFGFICPTHGEMR